MERDLRHAPRAHQVLGKLAAALAPPEPQLQHAALRLSARGWETLPLPAPDGSGAFVVALDLRTHEAVVEHSDGRVERSCSPLIVPSARSHALLTAVRALAGPVEIDPRPQETPWKTPLDEDDEHATYDASQVADYFQLRPAPRSSSAELRAPYRGRRRRSTPGGGRSTSPSACSPAGPADPPSQDFIMRNAMDAQEVAVGWWPGDARYQAAFYAYAHPAPEGFAGATLSPAPARWNAELGEYVLDWDDVCANETLTRTHSVRALRRSPRVHHL